MILDFRLYAFVTVARSLSFTKAAALLNVSQPAISKHIKELEADCGEALFIRQGNKIALTPKAKEILPLVQNILDGYNTLNDSIHSEPQSFEGRLYIGASTTISQYVLPTILAKFNKQYPNIKLSIRSANSEEIIEMLENKEIDLAIIEGNNLSNSVHFSELASDNIVLVTSKPPKSKLALDELTKLPLVIREEGSGTLSVILSALRKQGIARKKLNIEMQLGSSEAILRYLKASNNFAFVSVLVAKEHIERGELHVVEIENFEIVRKFRFATLHGQSGRLTNLFEDFCKGNYKF